MKIEKTFSANDGINVYNKIGTHQVIWFENEQERNIVFKHWSKAIEELEASKAIYRPVYQTEDGETHIFKLRYTTQQEVLEVDKAHKQHFPNTKSKLIMIYNEAERTFINVI